jgi:hypothetical protein
MELETYVFDDCSCESSDNLYMASEEKETSPEGKAGRKVNTYLLSSFITPHVQDLVKAKPS